jgi:DNA-binding SARP family transcriptional activator
LASPPRVTRGRPRGYGDLIKYALTTLAPVPRLVRLADGAECIRFSKQLAILAYVTFRPQARTTRDELVGLLWTDASQSDGRRALRQVVYQIRHATDSQLLEGEEVLTLRREAVEVDADAFRSRLAAGDLEGALAVYRQDFLATVALAGAREFEQWAEGVRAQLAAERRQLLRTLIAHESDAGRWAPAARYAEQLIAADPGSLEARLRLVELLALSGDVLRARAAADEIRAHAAEIAGDALPQGVERAVARALAPAAVPERRQTNGFPRAPEMVGRAVPFGLVVERWKAAQEGRGGAVLLTGEAGIGKTRLSRELAHRFAQDRSLVLESACYALEQSEPLAPFLEALRAARAAPGLAAASTTSLEILAALMPEVAVRFRPAVEPRVPPIPPQAVTAAVLEAIGAVADEASAALVVEDLHRAPPGTIEFAHHLARMARDHALLVVFTARDQATAPETASALRSLAASDAVTEIALTPLDVNDVENLLGSMAELPPEVGQRGLTARLVEHTDGIPLYLLEVLKELQDEEYFFVRNGRWTLGPAARTGSGDLPLPATGTDILRSRLQRLSGRLLEILAALAVWGRQTPVETLAEMAGLTVPEADEALATLERRRLVGRRDGIPVVAHDEIAAAALEIAPAQLVSNLHTYAAAVAAEAAKQGRGAEWSVAAMHAAAAGYAELATVWSAQAARDAERGSGRGAGREVVRRALAAAPELVRPQMERSLIRVLEGRWTAGRWLDERDGSGRRRRWRRTAAGAGLILAAAAVALFAARGAGRSAYDADIGGADLAIGWGMPGRPDSLRALRIDSDFVAHPAPLAALPQGLREGLYPNMIRPDHRAAAYACNLPGVQPTAVCLRNLTTGLSTPFVRLAGDAAPVGWLPDGSGLIVLEGQVTRAGGYAHSLLLADATGRVIRTILRDSSAFEGAWSAPMGDRIMLLRQREGRSEAEIIDLSGAVLAVVDWCDRSTKVTWSPDGMRVACLLEDTHILRIGPTRAQSWPSHVTLPAAVESGPVWSADGRFVAVSVGGRQPGVYVVDRQGLMEPRRVAGFPAAPRLIGWVATTGVPPLHKLNVRPDSLVMAVGSSTTLEAEGLGPNGEPLGPVSPVRWLATDTNVARVSEDGRVVADRPGRAAIVATFGLEQAGDTAYVRVDSAPVRLLVTEDFEHGLDSTRWRTYGTPPPTLVTGAGVAGSTGFLSRGTYFHSSGIVLRQPLPLDHGLTIEYWAQMPATRPLWQSIKVGLYATPADSFHLGMGSEAAQDAAAVSLEAPNPNEARRQMMAVVSDANPRLEYVPLPRRLADGRWHRFRLIVYPSGSMRWFADGREAMPPARANVGGRARWSLVVAGRSVGTLAVVDDIRVWQGVLLDPVQPARAVTRRAVQRRTTP